MNRIHLFRSATVALVLCAAAATSPAFAQTEIVQATNPDADWAGGPMPAKVCTA